jgi:hypothetical protein
MRYDVRMIYTSRAAVVAVALAASLTVLWATGATPNIDWKPVLEPLPSPAGPESSAPKLTSNGGHTILSWMERASSRASLKFSELGSGGWSAARTVVSGTDLIVNAADVPSVLALADGMLAGEWLEANGPDPEAYNLRVAWSKDGGATWSKAVSPHHDRTVTQHGFASLFQSPDGGLGLVWLDGRATDPDLPNRTDNMSLRGTLYRADGTQRQETVIDARVCECCPTSVAMTGEGPIVAFRNRSAQEVRDIYVSRLVAARWTMPIPVHHDNWKIDACPVNGPAISAIEKTLVVAWFTAKNDEGKAFAAFSSDGGRSFGTAVRVDDLASTGHVAAAMLGDGSAAVSWIEYANDRSQWKVRRVQPSGERSAAVTIAGAGEGRPAGNPQMARTSDGLVFGWTETSAGASRVKTAHAVAPAK